MMHALALQLAVLWISFWGIDIQAAQEAAQKSAVIIPPPTAEALPEEVAWRMIAAEGGGTALLLAIAVAVLWKRSTAHQERQEALATQRQAESRAYEQKLVETQAGAIADLSKAMIRVESAVRLSDQNNTNAIGRLSDTVTSAVLRLDKHEAKIEQHHESLMHHSGRLSALESRRTP